MLINLLANRSKACKFRQVSQIRKNIFLFDSTLEIMAEFIHQNLAQGKWLTMSLCEQLGNVGSEVGRAAKWQRQGNVISRDKALERAFDLLDMTIADTRRIKSLKELCRSREVLADTFYGDNQYKDSPEALEKYFYQYAVAARKNT